MFNIRLFAKNFCFKGRGAYSKNKKRTQEFFMCPTAESNNNHSIFYSVVIFPPSWAHTTQRKKRLRGCNFKKYTNKTQHHRKNVKKCEETFLNSAYNMRKILKNTVSMCVCMCVFLYNFGFIFFLMLLNIHPFFYIWSNITFLCYFCVSAILFLPSSLSKFSNAKKRDFEIIMLIHGSYVIFLCPTPPQKNALPYIQNFPHTKCTVEDFSFYFGKIQKMGKKCLSFQVFMYYVRTLIRMNLI